MIKKIMNPISYVIMFCFHWLSTLPLMAVVVSIIVAVINLLIFREPFGMWYVWFVLAISIMGAFVMTVETFEK